MKEFFLRPKVTLITIVIILAVILSGVYLYAVLRPGILLDGTFLLQQKDGSFHGSDQYAQYTLQIEHQGDDTTFTISINDITRVYEVLCNGQNVQILQDGTQIFVGHLEVLHGTSILKDDAPTEPDSVVVMGSPEQLFPGPRWLYNQSQSLELVTQGQPWMLAWAWVLAAILIVDICLPNLLFRLRYGWYVDGGEPSDYYRITQTVSRIILVILITVILGMGYRRY